MFIVGDGPVFAVSRALVKRAAKEAI